MHENCAKLLDKIREIGPPDYLEEIAKVLFDEEAFETAMERARAMDNVRDRLGKKIAPELLKALEPISKRNLMRLSKPLIRATAPDNLWKKSMLPGYPWNE